jgi:hypothetical protein
MKNLFLILATVLAFSTSAHAAPKFSKEECVPTKTVEEAKADYDASIAALNIAINNTYTKAVNDYNKAVANNLTVYNQQVAAINAAYDAEVKQITTDFLPGWQNALKAATDKHNKDLDAAIAQYDAKNKNEYAIYNQTVSRAQADYAVKAKAIADEYNKAVCAE